MVAATDVTGFSLLGHLHRMLRASGVRAVVSASAVPLLPGALSLTEAGYVSGGTRNNMSYLEPLVSIDPLVPEPVAVLLQDAQTSGGLLLATSVPDLLRDELARRGVLAAVVGRVEEAAGSAGRMRSARKAGRTRARGPPPPSPPPVRRRGPFPPPPPSPWTFGPTRAGSRCNAAVSSGTTRVDGVGIWPRHRA